MFFERILFIYLVINYSYYIHPSGPSNSLSFIHSTAPEVMTLNVQRNSYCMFCQV